MVTSPENKSLIVRISPKKEWVSYVSNVILPFMLLKENKQSFLQLLLSKEKQIIFYCGCITALGRKTL